MLQKMGEGEHYRDAGTGSPSTVAELKARINWIRIQGLEQTAGSRVWTRGPAMSLCPGITAPQSLGTSRTYMIPNTAWWVSSPADRPEQPWLLLREHSVFPVNTRSSGNTVPTSGSCRHACAVLHRRAGAEGCVLLRCHSQNQPERAVPAEGSGCIPHMFPCTRHAAVDGLMAAPHAEDGSSPRSLHGNPALALLLHNNLVWRLCEPERARAPRQCAPWEPSPALTSLEFHVCGRQTLLGFTKESEHLNRAVPPQG